MQMFGPFVLDYFQLISILDLHVLFYQGMFFSVIIDCL